MQAEVLVSTKDMEREEWLKWRRKGIGGSDAAAVAGMDPWKSSVEVWLEKTGQIEPKEDTERMEAGRKLEPVIADWFQEKTGLKVWRRNAILQHPKYPFMIANIDRRIVGRQEGLECKNTSEYMKGEWDGDKIPEMYQIQCQHYMAVTGYKAWWIAVLIGGNKFRYKRIERDEEIINYLIQIEKNFWDLVKKGVPPEMDGSPASTEILKKMYPEAKPDSIIRLPLEAKELIAEYELASEEEKAAKERKEAAANKLKNLLGENELGLIEDRKVSWKTIISTRFDSRKFKKDHPDLYEKYAKESKYRRFMIS